MKGLRIQIAYVFAILIALIFESALVSAGPINPRDIPRELFSYVMEVQERIGMPVDFGVNHGVAGLLYPIKSGNVEDLLLVRIFSDRPLDELGIGGFLSPHLGDNGPTKWGGKRVWSLHIYTRSDQGTQLSAIARSLGLQANVPTIPMDEFLGVLDHEMTHVDQMAVFGDYRWNKVVDLHRRGLVNSPKGVTDRFRGMSLLSEIEAHSVYTSKGNMDVYRAIWTDLQNEASASKPNIRRMKSLLRQAQGQLKGYSILQGKGARKAALRWLKIR